MAKSGSVGQTVMFPIPNSWSGTFEMRPISPEGIEHLCCSNEQIVSRLRGDAAKAFREMRFAAKFAVVGAVLAGASFLGSRKLEDAADAHRRAHMGDPNVVARAQDHCHNVALNSATISAGLQKQFSGAIVSGTEIDKLRVAYQNNVAACMVQAPYNVQNAPNGLASIAAIVGMSLGGLFAIAGLVSVGLTGLSGRLHHRQANALDGATSKAREEAMAKGLTPAQNG